MIEFLKSWLGDGDGHWSSTRILNLLVFLTCVLSPAIVWCIVSIKSGAMSEVPDSVIKFAGVAQGIAATLFAINKRAEVSEAKE